MKRKNGEVFGPYYRWIVRQPCLLRHTGCCWGPVQGHHIRTRGAGGTDVVGVSSHGNLVPLCGVHHHELHKLGRHTFARCYEIDLQAQAENLYRHWVGE